MKYYQEGPPGGPQLALTKIPIWDDKGGIFGSGASAMSSSKRHDGASVDEILHMYHTKAENRRDPQAQVYVLFLLYHHSSVLFKSSPPFLHFHALLKSTSAHSQMVLGQIYYQGSSVGTSIVHRNMKEAFKFFNMVAKQFFPDNDDTNTPDMSQQDAKLAGKAAGMLGKMYWRGEGVQRNLQKAKMWFMRGTQLDDPASANSLGEMLYDGSLGTEVWRGWHSSLLDISSQLNYFLFFLL